MTETRKKEHTPLISVIVPVFNVEKYIEKCVRSISEQTYQNLEIILVDDGATDHSPAIIDELSLHDDRIKVIHKKNGGLSSARNAGIDQASGDYLGFIDGDDSIDNAMYEKLFHDMITYQADITVCGFIRVYPERTSEIAFEQECLSGQEAFEKLVKYNRAGGNSACNKLYKSYLFEGIRYPEGEMWEDLQTTYQIFQRASQIYISSACYYYYYQRENSIVHSFASTKDVFKITSEMKRATCIYKQNEEIALFLYDGIANECMHKYIRVLKEMKTEAACAKDIYEKGSECYRMIEKTFPMSLKRKTIYDLFYKHILLFRGMMKICPWIK